MKKIYIENQSDKCECIIGNRITFTPVNNNEVLSGVVGYDFGFYIKSEESPILYDVTINGTLILDGNLTCNGDIIVTTSGKVIPVPDPDLMKTFYSYQTNSYITGNGGSRKITSTTGSVIINGVIDGEGAGFESNRGPGCNSLLTDSTGNPLGGYGATHAGLGYISNRG